MSTITAVPAAATAVPATTSTAPALGEDGLSETELSAWRGLLRAHAGMVKKLDAELERAHGLPLTSYEVLNYLDEAAEGRMRMCDLACSVLLSRSGLTRLVDRLEREGLLQRSSCAHDARGAYAVITGEGREHLVSTRQAYLDAVRSHFLSHFSAAELAQLGALWERVVPAPGAPCGEPDCA